MLANLPEPPPQKINLVQFQMWLAMLKMVVLRMAQRKWGNCAEML